jgi:hypothetical protein
VIGFTPREVDDCSLWEFHAARDGWIKANSADEGPAAPSDEDHEAMLRKWG